MPGILLRIRRLRARFPTRAPRASPLRPLGGSLLAKGFASTDLVTDWNRARRAQVGEQLVDAPVERGKAELDRLAALPATAWKTATIARTGRYRRPRLHDDMVKIKGVSAKVRQIAVKDIGRDEPTLLITQDLATPPKTSSPATPNG